MPKPTSSPTRCFWKDKIKWQLENNHFKELNRIDGMPTEFEKIFPGFTTLGLIEKIQDLMKDLQCEPEQFNNRIIFMSMYIGIAWGEKGNAERCEYNSKTIMLADSLAVVGLSWDLNGNELTLINPTDPRTKLQNK